MRMIILSWLVVATTCLACPYDVPIDETREGTAYQRQELVFMPDEIYLLAGDSFEQRCRLETYLRVSRIPISYDEEAAIKAYRDPHLHRSHLSLVLYDYWDILSRFPHFRSNREQLRAINSYFASLFTIFVQLGVDYHAKDILGYSAQMYLRGMRREGILGDEFLALIIHSVRGAPAVFLQMTCLSNLGGNCQRCADDAANNARLITRALREEDTLRHDRRARTNAYAPIPDPDACSRDVIADLHRSRLAALYDEAAASRREVRTVLVSQLD